MKFIASIFIILAFTPQSEAGELWDFFRGRLCPDLTNHMLCLKENKEDYYSGKCEGTLTWSPAEDEKFSLLIKDKNNKEDLKKLSDLNPYVEPVVCPVPLLTPYVPLAPEEDARIGREEREWLDCMAQKFYPTLLEALQCKELLKNSEPETRNYRK